MRFLSLRTVFQHNEDSQVKIYQNNRASNVFKEADKFDGKPYCIDGPNGEIVTLEEYPRGVKFR